MTNSELNEFIGNYIENNKTNSAIMLSAPWGTGKSYYIQKELIPFLESKEGKKIKCIVVSLYGLKDVDEISKIIFFETKASILNKKNSGIASGKIIGKAILKGVTNFFGIDLNVSKNDLKQLYKSIDLSNKLIILEDLERASINIIEILGYVNNLVGQDGVKVLLVANESEILKYNEVPSNENAEGQKKLTENSLYLKIKEKTISDTIQFYSSNVKAIDNILTSFNNSYFQQLLNNKDKSLGNSTISIEIEKEIMSSREIMNRNLRSVIFACQKTVDILNKIDFAPNQNFIKSILLSNIAFSLKKKNNDSIRWIGEESTSSELGICKYPLYKFSYDYICNQYFDLNVLKKANTEYCKHEEFEKNQTEIAKYLNVIYSYYVETEKKVLEAQNYIIDKLKTPNMIPFSEYGKLASYFIAIKDTLDCNDLTEQFKKAIINNLEKSDLESPDSLGFCFGIIWESKNSYEEYKEFKSQMISKISDGNNVFISFDYSVKNLDIFCEKIYKQKDTFVEKRCFAKNINNDKLIELLKICTSKQINDIREIYLSVYSFSNINEFFQDDKDYIKDLKGKVNDLSKSVGYDKIQIKQLKYFVDNLQNIENRL